MIRHTRFDHAKRFRMRDNGIESEDGYEMDRQTEQMY